MTPVRLRHIIANAFVAVLACGSSALALDPTLEISQYAHTAWKIRDGFTKGIIRGIAQTPDGFLWLGTEFGLLRFDGVRTTAWQPPERQPLPSSDIWSLLAAPDGALWIGTAKGVVRWKGGTITHYPELAGRIVGTLFQDRQGTVWASGLAAAAGILCSIRDDRVKCSGEDGTLGYGAYALYEDRQDNLWAGVLNGFWKWQPTPTFFPMPDEHNVVRGFAEDDDGALLVVSRSGIRRLADERTLTRLRRPFDKATDGVVLRDREGALWVATNNDGLAHIYHGRMDLYREPDGLSGNEIDVLFEDREGSIWAASRHGLDRFRDVAVPALSMKQGLPAANVNAVVASSDGTIWAGTPRGLARWRNNEVTTDARWGPPRTMAVFQDASGRIWIGAADVFGYLERERFVAAPDIRARNVRSIAQDEEGNLWIADQLLGLLRRRPNGEVTTIPWETFGHKDFASIVAADHMRGGVWIGFFDGGVIDFKDDKIRAMYSSANGLGGGRINSLFAGRDGNVWVATDEGLSRVRDGRISTVTTKSGLPCDPVQWVIEDDVRSMWLNTACGLVRVSRPDLDAWIADGRRSISTTVFDNSDGLQPEALASAFQPRVVKSRDGRLWFIGAQGEGLHIVDPRRLHLNDRPPPVLIEQVVADRTIYDVGERGSLELSLPALTRDLQIDYTALSLVAPEKNRFRIKLEGWDRDWQDVGSRRQAFYNNLPPRTYRFRVMASNNSGVWNEAGAVLSFAIAPAYYQTTWFALAIVGLLIVVIAGLHQLRLRRVAWQFNTRLEERVNERTRIARDLHDTLLQSFQGVLLKFGAVTYELVDRPAVKQKLETIIDEAAQAMTEGRDAVQALRSSTVVTNDLAQAITALADDLAHNQRAHTNGTAPVIGVRVEGTSRDLVPLVRDDVYRIAGEALRNAVRHAGATRIEVEIRYDARQLRVRVRDDGKGLDPVVLAEGRREGHYGLAGMRERADLVGAALTIWSDLGAGTEIELTLPAARAYAKSVVGDTMSKGQVT